MTTRAVLLEDEFVEFCLPGVPKWRMPQIVNKGCSLYDIGINSTLVLDQGSDAIIS